MNKPMKNCRNPECTVVYNHYKSSKSKYCCDSCRWRANHLKREDRNKERNTHFKAIKKAEGVIDFLLETGRSEFTASFLNQVKFNFKVMYGYKTLPDTTVKCRLGKYEVSKTFNNSYIFIEQ